MSVSPMVEQVNRIVGNLLAWSGEVALPSVGALYVDRRAAQRLSKRSVLPPCCIVEFTSQMRGVSLVDEIAHTAQCDAAQAQDIYDRWLTHVQKDDALTINGVGTLKFKNFTLDPAFDRLLNPQGHEPVRIKSVRCFDWVLWFGIAIIVLVLGGGTALWMTDGKLLSGLMTGEVTTVFSALEQRVSVAKQPADNAMPVAEQPSEQHTAVPQTAEQQLVTQPSQPPASSSASATTPTARESAQSKTVGTPDAPADFAAGRRYVVLGVFSTAENTARAIQDAEQKDASIHCSVFRFGGKFMVSPFDAMDAEPCTKFIRDNTDRFPGMWTYTAK